MEATATPSKTPRAQPSGPEAEVRDGGNGRRRRPGIARAVVRRALEHRCNEVAGEMAFDFSFSIFPAALFAATLAGLLNVSPAAVSKSLEVMGIFLHDQVRRMVEANVRALVDHSSEPLLTLGFLGAIWAASSAISATIRALNEAYGIRERRSFWYRRLLSVGLMFVVGAGMVVSFNLLVMGSWIEQLLLVRLGMAGLVPTSVSVLKWPVGFLGCIAMVCLVYRIAPNCRPCLRHVLPGALLFAALWFFLSRAFGAYVSHFSYYNRVTGTLGVIIVFQLWIYLTALLLLVGGELNAELAARRVR